MTANESNVLNRVGKITLTPGMSDVYITTFTK